MININTKFPLAIDDRVFMRDISIKETEIMSHYYKLLKGGCYTKASEYLNNSGVFFYGAWCLNLIENRLNAIGNYVIQLQDIDLLKYENNEPSEEELYDGLTWIE